MLCYLFEPTLKWAQGCVNHFSLKVWAQIISILIKDIRVCIIRQSSEEESRKDIHTKFAIEMRMIGTRHKSLYLTKVVIQPFMFCN